MTQYVPFALCVVCGNFYKNHAEATHQFILVLEESKDQVTQAPSVDKNRAAFRATCARLSLEVACNTGGHPIALSQEEASLILTAIVVSGLWTSADMTPEQRAAFLARLNLREGHKETKDKDKP